jgi:ATP-dependent DNA helicase RecG
VNRVANRRTPARRGPGNSPAESDALVRFHKVLELELKRGCDDRAVIGGIDRFLANARTDKDVRSVIEANAAPKPYASLRPEARERWLRALLGTKADGRSGESNASPRNGRPTRPSRTAGRAEPDSTVHTNPNVHIDPPAKSKDPLDQDVTVIKGVKGATQGKLVKLGLSTVRDLLYLFPNRHNDFANVRPISELVPDEDQTALVTVWSASIVRLGRRPGTQAVVGDDSGTMRVVWFNQPYLADQLHTNDRIVIAGKVGLFNRNKTMENPEWERVGGTEEDLTHTGRLVPVYPLTQGLSQRVLRRIAKEAVDRFAEALKEPLPNDLRQRLKLPDLPKSVRQMHYPDSPEQYEQARRRIAFEELFCVQLAMLERRQDWQDSHAAPLGSAGVLEVYRQSLPFALTGAQERVLTEITADLKRSRPMARLLQGDVGSGKTAVAGAALVIAVANGFQGALMAPTEILAEQHFKTLSSLLNRIEVAGKRLRVELLTGSTKPAARQKLVEAVESGDIDVIVGTHALIQEGVRFKSLGMAVVDEQHRFGVMQRAALKERAVSAGQPAPHLLVMSATPIPRTLALTFFGDLEVSVIDEMPPGRKPVETSWVRPEDRGQAYAFVREQVHKGRQAFVVCPLIEESEAIQSRSAVQEYERLSHDVFPDLRLGLLHGRMSSAEKDAVLSAFRAGELDVLVATTVIEVGIDIPNATVMVIEGADRFGLAQMHQLRGRVGRGADQSFCLLLSDDPSSTAEHRLQLLEDNNDGFALAEADLRLRGPGDYFGTRQSGLPEFQAADFSDLKMIETARQEAMDLLRKDPGLIGGEHAPLRAAVERMKRTVIGEVS